MASSAGSNHYAGRRMARLDFYLLRDTTRSSGTCSVISKPPADGFIRILDRTFHARPYTIPVELLVHESDPVLHPVCAWLFCLENSRAGLLDVRDTFSRFGFSRSQRAKTGSIRNHYGQLLRGDDRLDDRSDYSACAMTEVAPERVEGSHRPIL